MSHRDCDVCRDSRTLIDSYGEHLDLDDGYRLAWAVDGQGRRSIWIEAPICPTHSPHVTHGSITDAPHEQTGPIPSGVRRELFGDPRCGAPRSDGKPCRQPVRNPGDRCHLHAGQETNR